MLIGEFELLTGFYPSAELYLEIEREYAASREDKHVFCDRYKRNVDGLAERIARNCNFRQEREARAWHNERVAAEANLRQQINDLKYEKEKLEMELERELEWQPWTNKDAVSQAEYEKLINSSRSYELNDDEAKRWINREFGFETSRITILRTANLCEVNRHHMTRKIGEVGRAPWYDATDWYYVRFSVCGQRYEGWCGQLKRV